MFRNPTRREFFGAAAGGAALAATGGFGPQNWAVAAVAADSSPVAKVPLETDIEPLVRVLEDTPRERLLEEIGARIRRGTTYREIVAALQLAGVRNVEPRPTVGFKFHSVLVVNSAHLASISGLDRQRWLPIFWSLDYFKVTQAQDEREGDWTMAPVDESTVPDPQEAAERFRDAMERWDEGSADGAAAALARFPGSHQAFELFAHYGGRDFRSIGHKVIFVASAWRALQCIGWQYAEPILRSLAYALQNPTGDGNPAEHDHLADRPWRDNQQRVERIRDGWTLGRTDQAATREMLQTLRSGSHEEVCELAVEQLNGGVSPQSLWDAIFAGSGELLMRQPGIVALHAGTTSNAMGYLFRTVRDERTRQLLLLQNLAFLPLFRGAMEGRGRVDDVQIDQLEPAEVEEDVREVAESIFADVPQDRAAAARKTLALVRRDPEALAFVSAARQQVALRARGSHDYKFSSAVLEDYLHVSPPWRECLLAASVYSLMGAGHSENPLVQRANEALA